MELVDSSISTSAPGSIEDMRRLFRSRSIAVIGAKDSSTMAGGVIEAISRIGADGPIYPVHRSGGVVFGRPAARSCQEIGEPVDLALVIVPAAATAEVIADAGAAGIAGAVVFSSGWAESGADGRKRQDQLVADARRCGVTVIGPNCLGFANFARRSCGWVSSLPVSLSVGPVAVLSQSGGVGNAAVDLADEFGIGLSHVITTGNEAMLSTTDALAYLVEDDDTTVIAVFAEQIRNARRFRDIAGRARDAGKAIVFLKAGSSEISARNALSHTGSLVGNDRVIDAAFAQYGVIRVDSLEDLILTSGLIARTGPLRAPGVAVISISGGSCDIVADQAERTRLPLPPFDGDAAAEIRQIVPSFATVQNPLDLTGGSRGDEFKRVLNVTDHVDEVGVIAVLTNVPPYPSCKDPTFDRLLGTISDGLTSVSTPAVLLSQTVAHLNAYGRAAVARAGISLSLPGLHLGTQALAHLSWWSRHRLSASEEGTPVRADGRAEGLPSGVLSEWQSRRLLTSAGVPFVPAVLVHSVEEAVTAAGRMGGPVVLKLVSPDLPHKSDAGAVRLDVEGPAEVRQAYVAVQDAGSAACPGLRVDGVMVSPMRRTGLELLVGVQRDDEWGLVLVVGLGGVWVEILGDTAMRMLPVSRAGIERMLGELQGAALLRGARGRRPVEIDSLVDAVAAVAAAAQSLGDRLDSLEVNPLLVDGGDVEALDALLVLR
ncbi:acetate--CoA ligase family protein [Dactylosporangium sp. AC04546]|uniref:acetate--CoA ligase family protein n=1 Tax=Dactylosporangium sp. AC04546 TaxID=2862460 RepID=UPI001EDD2B3D|nr:acetate--CoA ligase family protein [Dactylosporangium sp. AC04546]WVK86928.1 acetate--CoA ligase family protein [Dactylosporangium sp. AC04546]